METAYGKMRLCENKESLARYHAAVHFTVGNIIEDCPSFSQPVDVKKFDRQTIAAIAEIVFRKIGILARDLEAFAKHAKRTKVTTDDVILCARRNPFLAKKLRDYANRVKDEKQDKLPNGGLAALGAAVAAAVPAGSGASKNIKQRINVGEVIDLSQLE
ncbi:centromere protein S-like isoform X1 [Varroa destructor]|uniref:Centromere protein S n=2 Tax=Varroa destructor TaxID=109461 RepID=A0A7M7JLB9_VARDE|nr:centromere protein S-like isoform X1 [Varroa destructor]